MGSETATHHANDAHGPSVTTDYSTELLCSALPPLGITNNPDA